MTKGDDLDAIFKETYENLLDYVQESSWQEATKYFRKVKKIIEGSTDDIFTLLASRFMDVAAAPGELGVKWTPLTTKWRNYKYYVLAGKPRKGSKAKKTLRKELNSRGFSGSDRFYYGIGGYARTKKKSKLGPGNIHLKDIVNAMSIEKTIGRPKIEMYSAGNDEVYLSPGKPNSVPRVRLRGSSRFASTKGLVLDLEINAYLMPNIVGTSLRDVIGTLIKSHAGIAQKMARLERQRPLFRPYFQWYKKKKQTEILNKIERL